MADLEINTKLARLLYTGQGIELLIVAAAESTAEVMRENISKTQGTGKGYKRNGRVHVASGPGQYPTKDSGNLVNSIDIKAQFSSNPEADIIMDQTVAIPLEYGTSKMRARPFIYRSIQDAFIKKGQKIINEFISYLDTANESAMLREYYDRYIRKPSRSQASQQKWKSRRGI